MIDALATAAFGDFLQGMAERLVPSLVTGLILLAGNVLYLRWRTQDLEKTSAALAKHLEKTAAELAGNQSDQRDRIDEAQRQRLVCKIEATETYATRRDLAAAIREQTERFDAVDQKLSSVHERITRLAENVSHMEGQQDASAAKPRRGGPS